ncbi:MAG: serine/threonine protein kinase [Bauldia sp.]|nr:serine/threonine protein kinase [Bauldia sp.]
MVGTAGVLIRGASGSGKSALALQLIEDARADSFLVADDRVQVWADDGSLFAAAPEGLGGLIEVRGIGLVRRPFRSAVGIRLVVDLLPVDECLRMPDARERMIELGGVGVHRLAVPHGSPDGAVRIRVALGEWFGATPQPLP